MSNYYLISSSNNFRSFSNGIYLLSYRFCMESEIFISINILIFLFRIDTNSLETIGTRDVKQYIGVVNHTSHPHIMSDGTVILSNINLN